MNNPEDALRRLPELRLPYPERARFARELREDLEDLTRELEARGCEPDDAQHRAREMLLPTDPAMEALETLHRSRYQGLTMRFSPDRIRRWERMALVALTGAAVAGALGGLGQADLLGAPSGFLAPVIVLGVLAVIAALAKAFHLFVMREHADGRLRAGLGATPALAGLTLAAAAAGFVTDLFMLAARMEAAPSDPGAVVLGFIGRSSVLLTCALVLALVAALVWFLLLQWVVRVEQEERELGLAPTSSHSLPKETTS
jgi:hypothetical protein